MAGQKVIGFMSGLSGSCNPAKGGTDNLLDVWARCTADLTSRRYFAEPKSNFESSEEQLFGEGPRPLNLVWTMTPNSCHSPPRGVINSISSPGWRRRSSDELFLFLRKECSTGIDCFLYGK